MASLSEVTAICNVLQAATPDGRNPYFDMQHDILYIPWDEETGEVADKLKACGCHWDEDAGSWATF